MRNNDTLTHHIHISHRRPPGYIISYPSLALLDSPEIILDRGHLTFSNGIARPSSPPWGVGDVPSPS